ncbi:MAG: hypothetical protein OEV44_02605 [Spirochaetota bacterium]|nr:hypothetical protein [Spirochaetota bacterium]
MKKKFLLILLLISFVAYTFPSNYDDDRESRYYYKYYGTINKLPTNGYYGIWIINKRSILVNKKTKIKEKYGKIELGAYVEIEGYYIKDQFVAYKIEVEISKKH